jgi:osmotically inducible protein OsmC
MQRTANSHWNGTLMEGTGDLSTQSTVLNNTQYSFKTRFADGIGTNPEELIAAALAGCFSMALSATLAQESFTAAEIFTTATVDLDLQALSITGIHLELKATPIDGLDATKFKAIAEGAKAHCIISKALIVPITLNITYA